MDARAMRPIYVYEGRRSWVMQPGYGSPTLDLSGLGAEGVHGPGCAWAPGGPTLGAEATAVPSDAADYLPKIAETVAAYTQSSDPRVQIAVLKQRIANHEKMKRAMPFAAVFYDNEIAKMRAKIAALREKAAVAREGEQATRTWRTLGFTGAGLGIVLGASLVALTFVGMARLARKS
jgi:hypothetical protein